MPDFCVAKCRLRRLWQKAARAIFSISTKNLGLPLQRVERITEGEYQIMLEQQVEKAYAAVDAQAGK